MYCVRRHSLRPAVAAVCGDQHSVAVAWPGLTSPMSPSKESRLRALSAAALATAAADRNLIQCERRHRGQALERRHSLRRGQPPISRHLRPWAATRRRRSNPPIFLLLAHAPPIPRRRVPVPEPPLHPPRTHVPDPRPPVALQPLMSTSPIPIALSSYTLSCPRPQTPLPCCPVAPPPYPLTIPTPLPSHLRHALPCACVPTHLPGR